MRFIAYSFQIGLRQYRKRPGLCLALVITLMLGIGVNIAVFSVLNGYLIKPLPYDKSRELVTVSQTLAASENQNPGISLPVYHALAANKALFSSAALYQLRGFIIRSGNQTRFAFGAVVTPNLFHTLGETSVLRGDFRKDAVILSHAMREELFGNQPDVIGRTLRIRGERYRIIGVTPEGFAFPSHKIKFWLPMQITAAELALGEVAHSQAYMVARLASGQTSDFARQRLQELVTTLTEQGQPVFRAINRNGLRLVLTPLRKILVHDRSGAVLFLQIAALLILLIACANAASLFLVSILDRSKEMAIRTTLGAGSWRLAGELLTETLSLTLLAGGAGTAFGWWLLGLMENAGLGPGNSVFTLTPDWRVAFFSVLVVVLVTLFVSLLPFWQLQRAGLNALLGAGGGRQGETAGSKRLRAGLVILEIGFTTVLLIGSGLLLKNYFQLEAVNPGYQTDNIASAYVVLPPQDPNLDALGIFYHSLEKRLQQLPGVLSVGLSDVLPFSPSQHRVSIVLRHHSEIGGVQANIQIADAGFFESLGIQVLHGRGFSDRDRGGQWPVALIDEQFARQHFPKESPLGQQLQLAGHGDKWFTIIGVIPDILIHSLADSPQYGTIYVPLTNEAPHGIGVVMRTTMEPDQFFNPLRHAVYDLNPAVALFQLRSLQDRMEDTLARHRATTGLLLAFGMASLLLAAIGVYSMLSYSVRREMLAYGVRLALGASPTHLQALILYHGLKILTLGLLIGAMLTFALVHSLASQIVGMSIYDLPTYLLAIFVLFVVVILVIWVPSRKAANVNPVDVMRIE